MTRGHYSHYSHLDKYEAVERIDPVPLALAAGFGKAVEWGMGAEQFRNLTHLILEAAAAKCEENPMVVKTGFECAKAIRRMKP